MRHLNIILKSKNWGEADYLTYQFMLRLARRTIQTYLEPRSINRLSCPDLQTINQLWVDSDKRFGFSVQKEIWIKTGMRMGIKNKDFTKKDSETYGRFIKTVGNKGYYNNYLELHRGALPTFGVMGGIKFGSHVPRNVYEPISINSYFVLRLKECNL